MDLNRYKEVPSHEYDGLMSAESTGEYMQQHIFDRDDYERVDDRKSSA